MRDRLLSSALLSSPERAGATASAIVLVIAALLWIGSPSLGAAGSHEVPTPRPSASPPGLASPSPSAVADADLRLLVAVNGRIASTGRDIANELASKPADSGRLVVLLRQVNSDVRSATDSAARVAGTPSYAALGADLVAAYDDLGSSISTALALPLADRVGYERASAVVLEAIRALEPIAARITALGS